MPAKIILCRFIFVSRKFLLFLQCFNFLDIEALRGFQKAKASILA